MLLFVNLLWRYLKMDRNKFDTWYKTDTPEVGENYTIIFNSKKEVWGETWYLGMELDERDINTTIGYTFYGPEEWDEHTYPLTQASTQEVQNNIHNYMKYFHQLFKEIFAK
jgi:hypothetical protein